MNCQNNDNVPQLFGWIFDNPMLWLKLYNHPNINKDDFIEIMKSLREAGMYQMAFLLLVKCSHMGYLNSVLKDMMLRWGEKHMTPEFIDKCISHILKELEPEQTLEDEDR